jgi:hypothetical protein
MAFPAGVLLPVFLLGVLAVDLTFDVGGLPPATTVTYYAGLKAATFPANKFVIFAIVLGSVPYVQAMRRPQLIDYISLGVLTVCLAVFVGYLIPTLVRVDRNVESRWFWDAGLHLHRYQRVIREVMSAL